MELKVSSNFQRARRTTWNFKEFLTYKFVGIQEVKFLEVIGKSNFQRNGACNIVGGGQVGTLLANN